MKPTITITVSGGKEAAHLCDALHCLNGSRSAGNIEQVVAMFAREEIATEWDPAPASPQPATPVLVPLGENRTRDGQEARVICTDAPDTRFPVIYVAPTGMPVRVSATGSYLNNGTLQHDLDLVGHLPPEPVKPREFWICAGGVGEERPRVHLVEQKGLPSYIKQIHVREVL